MRASYYELESDDPDHRSDLWLILNEIATVHFGNSDKRKGSKAHLTSIEKVKDHLGPMSPYQRNLRVSKEFEDMCDKDNARDGWGALEVWWIVSLLFDLDLPLGRNESC